MAGCCNNSGFWDVSINDVSSVIIAVINIILLLYIFVYQRGKDKKDRKLLIDQVHADSKLEWFKIIVIEPNVNRLYVFFDLIHTKLDQYNNNPAAINLIRTILVTDLNEAFNEFERNFINVLDSIDAEFKQRNLNCLDDLRDYLSNQIAQVQVLTPEFFIDLETHTYATRNQIISNVVNYDFFRVNE